MMPRTAIAHIVKLIGRELESGVGPSEGALATGPTLAEAGATNEIAERLFAEAHRKRPNNRMIEAYAFMLEGALGTLRVQANGGDVGAEHTIDEVRNKVDQALGRTDVAPEVLMLLARAFARAELDPGRSVQQAMVNAMEAQSRSGPTALSPEELSDHFAELAAALDNDPFAIYAELASMAAVFPTEHNAAVAGALARSENEAVREAALGFIFSPDRAARSAALVAVTQQPGLVSSKTVDRLVRMRPWVSDAPGEYRHCGPRVASESSASRFRAKNAGCERSRYALRARITDQTPAAAESQLYARRHSPGDMLAEPVVQGLARLAAQITDAMRPRSKREPAKLRAGRIDQPA